MSVNISYMGTKRELAPAVVEVIDSTQPGPVLDIFSGMCSVGEAIGTRRQVWTNDVQLFAHSVATAMFCSADEPLRRVPIADIHFDIFLKNKSFLTNIFSRSIESEVELLESKSFDIFEKRYQNFKKILAKDIGNFSGAPYSLFTWLYADSYFGIVQSIEIDALVATIQKTFASRMISPDQHRWLLVGLGRAMLRVANSTGHFAQFLKPKPHSYGKFVGQRKRRIWLEWLDAADEMAPVGNKEWRSKNKSYNEDCLDLIPSFSNISDKPSVIYADPPYTDDQYSRYYHLLETLLFYDYPVISGVGMYRAQRFRTSFSVKSLATLAIKNLIEAVAKVGADFVLSYPTNGLIYENGDDPEVLMRQYFRSVERCHAIAHNHSTFGASKGSVKAAVTEQIFVGRL